MRAGAAAALAAGMLLACVSARPAGAPDEEADADADAAVTVSGRVTVTGSEPHVRLVVVTAAETYELVGPAAAELQRLQQRRVTVRGRVVRAASGPGFPAQLRVDSYALERGADG